MNNSDKSFFPIVLSFMHSFNRQIRRLADVVDGSIGVEDVVSVESGKAVFSRNEKFT